MTIKNQLKRIMADRYALLVDINEAIADAHHDGMSPKEISKLSEGKISADKVRRHLRIHRHLSPATNRLWREHNYPLGYLQALLPIKGNEPLIQAALSKISPAMTINRFEALIRMYKAHVELISNARMADIKRALDDTKANVVLASLDTEKKGRLLVSFKDENQLKEIMHRLPKRL